MLIDGMPDSHLQAARRALVSGFPFAEALVEGKLAKAQVLLENGVSPLVSIDNMPDLTLNLVDYVGNGMKKSWLGPDFDFDFDQILIKPASCTSAPCRRLWVYLSAMPPHPRRGPSPGQCPWV